MDRGAWRTQFMGLQKLDRTEHAHIHTVIGNNVSFYSLNLVFSETGPNTGNFHFTYVFTLKIEAQPFIHGIFFFYFFSITCEILLPLWIKSVTIS